MKITVHRKNLVSWKTHSHSLDICYTLYRVLMTLAIKNVKKSTENFKS